jgi:hypothetical protein
VIETGRASTSFLQTAFKVGYSRAGRIINQMEQRGIISGYRGSKPREVLISKERWQELKMAKLNVDGDTQIETVGGGIHDEPAKSTEIELKQMPEETET